MKQSSKFTKACKAMKAYDIPEETVKLVLMNLLDLYDKNWKLIEEENYRALLDAIFDSEGAQSDQMNNQEFSEDEPEECAPLVKKAKLRCQTDQSLSSIADSESFGITTLGVQNTAKAQVGETPFKQKEAASGHQSLRQEETRTNCVSSPSSPRSCAALSSHQIVSRKEISTYKRVTRAKSRKEPNVKTAADQSPMNNVFERYHNNGSISESEPPVDVLRHSEVPLAVIHLDPPSLLEGGCSNGSCADTKENCSKFPELIDLDTGDPFPLSLSCKDDSPSGNRSNPERYSLDCRDSKQIDRKNQDSSVITN